MTEMKKGRSEVFKKTDEVYREMKSQNFEVFSTIDMGKQVMLLFYFFTKFDKMLTELFLSIKIVVHLTAIVHLHPRFQQHTDSSDKVVLSGSLMATFARKYRILSEHLTANLDEDLVIFDHTASLYI